MTHAKLVAAIAAFTAQFGRPPTILFDADGVAYDWEENYVATHREHYPDRVIGEPGTRDRFDFFTDVPADEREAAQFILSVMDYATLTPMPGVQGAVQTLLDAGADVLICTAPTLENPTCESAKKLGIVRDFGAEFAGSRIIIIRDKTYALGDLLIDDKPQVTGRRIPTWAHIYFTQLYNRHLDRPRINSWLEGWEDVIAEELRVLVDARELVNA